MPPTQFEVALYYHFVDVEDPEALAASQRILCQSLGLLGRIVIASEGINGTLSGTSEAIAQYRAAMHTDRRFAEMPFKLEQSMAHKFRRLSVRVKEEIVVMRSPVPLNPSQTTGEHLSPRDFLRELRHGEALIIDGRNDYEFDLGHFEGALRPDVRYFREFPEWLDKHLPEDRTARILTYCTGGIRCEKLTSFLIEKGYENVAQLNGGIIHYAQDPSTQGQGFVGKCYVFDQRMAVTVNPVDSRIVGRCHHCAAPCDRHRNCAYDPCHLQYLCCESCEVEHRGFCSPACAACASRAEQGARVSGAGWQG